MLMKKIKVLAWTLSVSLLAGTLTAFPTAASQPSKNNGYMLKAPLSDMVQGAETDISFDFASEDAMVSSMKKAAENDRYILYYDPASLAIALQEKSTKAVFLSNPFDAAQDPLCTGDLEKEMESQVVLTYIDAQNNKSTMYSSADCASMGQFGVTEYAQGVKFDLSIGREQQQRLVPEAFSTARFDEMIGKLQGRAQRRMNIFYKKFALSDINDEAEKKQLLEKYPTLASQDLYLPIDLSEREKNEIEKYLKEAGYTAEMFKADMAAMKIKVEETYFPNFKMALEYVLTDNGLTVNIPNESVTYDKDHFALLSIRLLQFFGADKPNDKGSGYLFIPDGSGALVHFNNQSPNRRPVITGDVYGIDAAMNPELINREGQTYRLPVFGVVRNNQSAAFAIIESSDEISQITARLGEPNSRYYTVFNTFIWTAEELITMDTKVGSLNSAKKVFIHDANVNKQDMRISYHGLFGDQANYTAMAQTYRSYLQKQGMNQTDGGNPLALGLQTIGTALYEKDFLGFSYMSDTRFTPYSKSQEIADYYRQQGVSHLNLTLIGWRKHGLDAGIANKVKLSGALGGKKDFEKLLDYAKKQSIDVYPDVDMLFVKHDKWADGFSKMNDAARMLNREYAGIAPFEPDTQQYGVLEYAISPGRYTRYFNSFFKGYQSLHSPAVSLGTVGNYLNSDFNKSSAYNRGQTADIIDSLLAEAKKQYRLGFEGGNAYVLPYATLIRDIALTNSEYLGETAAVPFLQMVLNGSVQYQSAAINLNEDSRAELLRCIESHTSPSFTLAAENIMRFKQTDYSQYYAVSFDVLKKKVLEQYQYVENALEPAAGSRMIGHRILADGVVCTSYENGARIYVNYTAEPYTAGTLTVPANGYASEKSS